MATTGDERVPVSWEDLLAAINPPKATPEEMYERALDEVVMAWREGHLTDEEADDLINELITARVRYEMRGMIKDAFSPDAGRSSGNSPRHRFSLI